MFRLSILVPVEIPSTSLYLFHIRPIVCLERKTSRLDFHSSVFRFRRATLQAAGERVGVTHRAALLYNYKATDIV
jgi:hypothetical protein